MERPSTSAAAQRVRAAATEYWQAAGTVGADELRWLSYRVIQIGREYEALADAEGLPLLQREPWPRYLTAPVPQMEPEPEPAIDAIALLQAAVDVLDQAESVDGDASAEVAISQAGAAGMALVAAAGAAITAETVTTQHDVFVAELIGSSAYRDAIRENLNVAIACIQAAQPDQG